MPPQIPNELWPWLINAAFVIVGYLLRHKGINIPLLPPAEPGTPPAPPVMPTIDIAKWIPQIPGVVWDDIARILASRLQSRLQGVAPPAAPAPPGGASA